MVFDTQVRIINKAGIDVAMNDTEIGEIIVKGKSVIPDETSKSTKDGWVYTGDFGTMDCKGQIRVVKNNVDINAHEDELSTIAIEKVLADHNSIQEVSVIPEPDDLLGEIAHAFVVIVPEINTTESELITYITKELSTDESPIKLTIMDELPKTLSGKILKNQLG